MKFSITIKDGKVKMNDKLSFDSFLENLNGQYVLEVYKRKKKRSIDQNSLYWLWMGYLSEQTGYEKEWWHRYFMSQFLLGGTTITTPHGQHTLFNTRSTTELDTAEMADYMNKIQIHSLEFGYVLPNPEDLNFKNINLTNI